MVRHINKKQWVESYRPRKRRGKPPDLETLMLQQIQAENLSNPRHDKKLHKDQPRKWRYDFIFDKEKVILEVEGGTFLKYGGRHTKGEGFNSDCHKYAYAMLQGYQVLRVDSKMVQDGSAMIYLKGLLKNEDITGTRLL